MSEARQLVGVGNVFFFLYTLPIALGAVAWLISVTNWGQLNENAAGLALIGLLMLLFSRLNFYTIVEIHPGTFANADSSLSGVILWSGLLLFGPEVLWLPLLGKAAETAWQMRRAGSRASRWVYRRTLTLYCAAVILPGLVGISLYRARGGLVPIGSLDSGHIISALGAVAVHILLFTLVYTPFILYIAWAQGLITASSSRRRVFFFFALALGLPFLAYPFGVLAAGLYSPNDLFSFLFFVFGIGIVALLSRQLSRVAESSRQQFRQLVQLEVLGREIINSSPDAGDLPHFLEEHIPVMFPSARVVIWVEPDTFLLRHPGDWFPAVQRFWEWLLENGETTAFEADTTLPWREGKPNPHNPVIVTPIQEMENREMIGFIYIELQTLVQPWDRRALSSLFPGVNTLSAQIASARRQAQVYEEALDLNRAAQELEFASEIQASFFPDQIPAIPGWELAVTILPAREMAGDFFDFIPLGEGRLGILIADVTDKGVGPALYMALSRTLIRTYAIEYEFEPDTIFFAANRRILQDARARLFVTVFFGVLDTNTGVLTYSNAGHNPPYLLRSGSEDVESLGVTGMPIGIQEESVWEQAMVQINPGDVLLLYTDGIPDAINTDGDFFNEDRFVESARENLDAPAYEIQATLIQEVQSFAGDAEQVDDITLMVLKRDGDPLTSS